MLMMMMMTDVSGADDITDVRLTGGRTNFDGRVEVHHNDAWGTVCDDQFDNNACLVICRQLGYRSLVITAFTA